MALVFHNDRYSIARGVVDFLRFVLASTTPQ